MEDLNANVAPPLDLSLSVKGGGGVESYLKSCPVSPHVSLSALVVGPFISTWCQVPS
jgi:hypothetical protein